MISGIRRAAVFAVIFLPHAVQAQQLTLDQVMQKLAQIHSASAHFVEEKSSAALTEPLRSEGTLLYTAPSHVEKITESPDTQRLMVDGTQVTIEQDGQTRSLDLTDYPEIRIFVESIRSTLAGDAGALEQYYNLGFKSDTGGWTLSLQPTNTDMQQLVTDIRITGSGASLRQIETNGTNGDHSTMTITPLVH